MSDVSALIAAASLNAPIPVQKQADVAAVSGAKQDEVNSASDAKRVELGGLPDKSTFLNAAITRLTGAGASSATGVEQDLGTLSRDQILAKYPEQGQAMLDNLDQATRIYQSKIGAVHQPEDWLGDSVVGLGQGISSIGSTVPLALGIGAKVLDKVGLLNAANTASGWAVGSAQGLQNATDWMGGFKSPALQAHDQANSSKTSLDIRDNTADYDQNSQDAEDQYVADKNAGDSDWMAGAKLAGRTAMNMAKRSGSDALSTLSNISQNPDLILDNTAQFGGSLLGAKPLGLGLKVAGSVILPTATRVGIAGDAAVARELGVNSGSRVLDRTVKALPGSNLTSMGAVEGASTYQGNALDVANMSPDELQANPKYQELIAQGLSPEDAKNKLANDSGLVAAASAAPLSMAVAGASGSKLAEKLTSPVGHTVSHLITEAAHEGGLGVTDTLSSNLGKKEEVDPNQDLSEGVGQQLGMAALGGFMSTGASLAPKAALDAAKATGRLALKPVTSVASAINASRTAKAEAPIDASVAQAGAQAQAQAQAPETKATLDDAITKGQAQDESNTTQNQSAATPGAALDPAKTSPAQPAEISKGSNPDEGAAVLPTNNASKAQALSDKILARGNFDPTEITSSTLPDTVKSQVAGSTSRVDMLQKLAKVIQTKGANTPDGLAAYSYLQNQLDQHFAVTDTDPEGFEALSDDSPAGKLNLEYNKLSDQVVNSPAIAKAVAQAKSLSQDQVSKLIQPVTPESLSTPQGQQNVQNALSIAATSPEKGNLEALRAIQDQHDAGKLSLTANQIAALRASVGLMQASKDANEQAKAQGITKPILDVNSQILSGGDEGTEKRSAAQFTSQIYNEMKSGDREKAQDTLNTFGQFVQHMQNKLVAINTHYANGGGDKVANLARNSTTGEWYETKGQARQSVTPMLPSSVERAQMVAIEAKQLSDVYNGLSKAFPALKAGIHTSETLHKGLQGTIRDVVKAHSPGGERSNRNRAPMVPSISKPGQSKTLTTTRTIKAAKEAEANAEATTGEKVSPQAKASDEGAEASQNHQEMKDLTDKLREIGIAPRAKLDEINDRLAKLSDHEVLLVNGAARNQTHAARDISGKSKTVVVKQLAVLAQKLGLPLVKGLIRMVREEPSNDSVGGYFYRTGSYFTLSRKILALINSDKVNPAGVLRVIAHEMSHAIAFHAAKGTDSREISEDDKFNLDGDLWREFLGLKGNLPEGVITPNYEYISGQPDEESESSEFFAELGAFVLSNPDLAKELIPNGSKAFDDALDQARSNLRLGEEGSRGSRRLGEDSGARSQTERDTKAEPVSRISSEQLAKLTDSGLAKRIDALQAKQEHDESTPEDDVTLKALEGENDRRAQAEKDALNEPFQREEPKNLKEAYPGLIGSQGENVTNWFQKAFRVSKNVQSRLLGLNDPAKALKTALSSQASFEAFTGKPVEGTIPKVVFKNYQSYLDLKSQLKASMNKVLMDKLTQDKLLEPLLTGAKNFNSSRFGRVLNLIERQPDGSYIYNDKIVDHALTAALQWLLISDQFQTPMDVDKVHALTDIPVDDAGRALSVLLEHGPSLSPTEAVQSLATKITQYWGVKDNGDVPLGHTQGIPLAMAAEILEALRDTEISPNTTLLDSKTFTFTSREHGVPPSKGKPSERTTIRLRSNLEKIDKETGAIEPLFITPTLIEHAVLTQPHNTNFYAGDKIPVAPTQMNNPYVPNTKESKQAIRSANSIEYRLNEPIHKLYGVLGLDNQFKLFGGGVNLDNRPLNERDKESRQGQNTMVRTAWENIQARVAEMGTRLEAKEGLWNVVTHFAHNMSAVGRLQQLGGVTPQGNKPFREVMTPTWSTVDLNQDKELHFFKLALAQSLGVKISQKDLDTIENELRDALYSKFARSIDILQDYLKSGTMDANAFTDKALDEFNKAGEDFTPNALHALHEYARWLNSGEKDLSEFKTALYVEADGVTNGVANAVNLFSSAGFNADDIENLKRGGRFLDGTKTMNDYRSKGQGKDFYTVAASKAKSIVESMYRKSEDDPATRTQMNHTLKLLNMLGKGITFDEDTNSINFDRSATKNPMTITMYGSGADGIAGNLVGEMADKLYRKLSDASEKMKANSKLTLAQAIWGGDKASAEAQHSEFMKTLNGLITVTASKVKGALTIHDSGIDAKPKNFDPVKFEFSPGELKAMRGNVLHMVVDPMRQGIDETLGKSMMDAIKLVQRATQAQSVSLEHQFAQEVKALQEKRAKEDPNYHVQDGLSKDDLHEIMENLLKTHPLVEHEDQKFFPVREQQSDMKGADASSFRGGFVTSARVHTPADAGVKSLSMLNQGMGDGNMIQRMMINHAKGLPVFDGFNFGLDQVEQGNLLANKSAYEAQGNNPQRAVYNAFKVFAENLTPERIENVPGLKDSLAKSLLPPMERKGASPKTLIDALESMRDELSHNADMVDARHQALEHFASSNDQMAGTGTAYQHPGDNSLIGSSSKDIAKALNERMGKDLGEPLRGAPPIEPEEQPTISDMNRQANSFHDPDFGDNDRITKLNTMFDNIFGRFLNPTDPIVQGKRVRENQLVQKTVTDLTILAKAHGFGGMTLQAEKAFGAIVTALSLDIQLDGSSLAGAEKLYRVVVKELHPGLLADWNDPDPISREGNAQLKYDMLTGNAGIAKDAQGRSSLLPVFMGLATVDDGLRDVLSKLELPKSEPNHEGGVQGWIDNQVVKGLDSLASKMSGQNNPRNIQDAIDQMTDHIAREALDTTSTMQAMMGVSSTLVNAANDKLVQAINNISDKVVDKSREIRANTQSETLKKITQVTEFMGHFATEKGGEHLLEAGMTGLNNTLKIKGWQAAVHDITADVIGRIASNSGPYDLIKIARAMVQQARQQFNDHVPKMFADSFSRSLDKSEWSALHLGLAKSDLASLDHDKALDFLAKPSIRARAIQDYENDIKAIDPQHFTKVQAKAQQLASYMMTGTKGVNLLRNARAVANLLNEKTFANRAKITETYVENVDRLTTLYALNHLSSETQAQLSELVKNESEGMKFTLAYVNQMRQDEQAKSTGMALYNSYKGFVPSKQKSGVSIKVANDRDRVSLEQQSWRRIADYNGSKAEGIHESKGYYFLPASARASFTQGFLQNVQRSGGGVDMQTGESIHLTGGIINNPVTVARITQRLALEGNQASENLVPIFNARGKVIAYERSLDKAQLSGLDYDTNLARMAGVWRGRQVEERVGHEFNLQSIDKLKDMLDADLKKNANNIKQYVNLWNPKSYDNDPIIRDAMSLMTPETREYIKETFGNQFLVRRDMIKDAIGYRNASVGDAWTGTTRWSPEVQEGFKNVAMALMGNEAYQRLVNYEGIGKEIVNEAKSLIMIKSLVMPAINIASDTVQMLGRGVSMQDIVRGTPKKITEVAAYVRGRMRKLEAEAELYVSQGKKDFQAQLKLKAELQSIDDMNKRLSIWPLIQNGEFGLIADLGNSRGDLDIVEGKMANFISKLTDKLPEAVRTAGNYALIGADTPLYEGIQKTMEYGDFIMKCLYYDHLLKNRKLSSKDALGKVSEEFVNFDRSQGRFRGYLENMGLAWFYNYKLRSAKIALSVVRDNPLQTILGSIGPVPSAIGIDKFLGDNIFGKVWEGNWIHSIGPGMLGRAPMMHPLADLLY